MEMRKAKMPSMKQRASRRSLANKRLCSTTTFVVVYGQQILAFGGILVGGSTDNERRALRADADACAQSTIQR